MNETKNFYSYPYPDNTEVRGIIYESETHYGPFSGAEDHLMDLEVPILAPLDGVVINVVDWNSRFGPGPENSPFLNYITIKHQLGEFSQLAHLKKASVLIKPGECVKEGQQIALTGNAGRMTEPHLHWLVFEIVSSGDGFQSLKIRYKKKGS